MFSGPRGVALGGVLLLHAALVIIIGTTLRHSRQRAPAADFVSTVIFVAVPVAATRARGDAGPTAPAVVAPTTAITVPLPEAPAGLASIDWDAAARRAAAATPAPARPLDRNPAAAAAPPPATPAVAEHHAGEEYRGPDGSTQVWVSDRCFVVTSPPPLGAPDVIGRAIPTRTVCKGDPGWSRGDLFRDLPAYRRYHPAEPGKP